MQLRSYKIIRRRLFTILMVLSYQVGLAQLIYVNAGRDIFSFDPLTCEYTLVVRAYHGFTDIAFDRHGTLYGCGNDLERINLVTGGPTKLVEIGTIANGMTISANDVAYFGGIGGQLISYDLNTGVKIDHGNMGFGCAGDLTFYKGELYMAAWDNQFIRVNIDHPEQSELLFTHQSQAEIVGIISEYVNCNETNVYALSGHDSEIFLIDFINLKLDLICQLPINISGGASTSEFLSSIPVTLGTPEVINPDCNSILGSISFPGASGYGILAFRLNEGDWQSEAFLDSLSPGSYMIELMDEQGCSDTTIVIVQEFNSFLVQDLAIDTAHCGKNDGQFSFSTSGGTGTLLFSLDGISYQSDMLFTGLSSGNYTLYIKDETGCIVNHFVAIPELSFDSDLEYEASSTTCSLTDGMILLFPHPEEDFDFALNGGTFLDELSYNHLAAGTYTLFIRNNDGCLDTMLILVDGSSAPELILANLSPASCSTNNGMIEVVVHGGTTPFFFKIDSHLPQLEPIFDLLTPDEHTIYVTDLLGCIDSLTTEVPLIAAPMIQFLKVVPASCYANTGEIQIDWHSSDGPGDLKIYDQTNQLLRDLDALAAGVYYLVLTDASGCTLDTMITIPTDDCDRIIPNIFSPNGDGANDEFVISSHPSHSDQLIFCSIFDREGNQVFQSSQLQNASPEIRWDGKNRGKECASGVYVYILQTATSDGKQKNTYGNIALIR